VGTIASLLARAGARVEQFNARHPWLRYILLVGLLFTSYGYGLDLIDVLAFVISTYVLALLYFWTIPKQERQQYNFTVPKKRINSYSFCCWYHLLCGEFNSLLFIC